MQHDHVLSALTRKRAELHREIEAATTRLRALNDAMSHVTATILLFDPQAQPPEPKPRAKHGSISRAVMGVLREAAGGMTAGEIAGVAGLTRLQVTSILQHMKLRGLVRNEEREGRVGWMINTVIDSASI